MTWLVFGMSCLLVLAGAVSVISGAPIIQLERGWAEVIAGTMALSSGGVVFALAVILMRLEALRDTMAAGARVVDAASVIEAESQSSLVTPLPLQAVAVETTDPSSLDEEEPASSEDSAIGQGLWKRVRRPTDDPAPPFLEQDGFPDRVTPTDTPSAVQPAVTVVEDEAPTVQPEPVAPAPISEPAKDTESAEPEQLGWLERSLFKGRLPKARPDLPFSMIESGAENPFVAPATSHHTRIEPSLNVGAVSAAGTPQPENHAETPASLVETPASPPASAMSDEVDAQGDGVTVIGRYQAGVASYVMYSDGTIEVETEGGEVHRFGSMDELKTFIADQDKALS